MKEIEFERLLSSRTKEAEEIICKYLPKETGMQKTVIEAMNYSVLAGGKRLRPIMMREVYEMFGGAGKVIEPFMAAIEMIHTYSLVHDDLPAMDNDEYRRGRKTTWSVYGEGMGVLCGDALLNYAFETALLSFSAACKEDEISTDTKAIVKALSILAQKAGIYGMIGGQCADVEAEECSTVLTNEQLLFIHEHKTAALIQASMMIGAVLAGASDDECAAVEKCAYNIGVAFQIQDDILDVTGDSAELGKNVGSDENNNKQTYVTVNGLDKSAEDVSRLSEEAIKILDGFDRKYEFLRELILMLVHRRK
jgi:geranylgeranyl diphosphate synthase type II